MSTLKKLYTFVTLISFPAEAPFVIACNPRRWGRVETLANLSINAVSAVFAIAGFQAQSFLFRGDETNYS